MLVLGKSLNSKDELEKYTKEQLIDMFWEDFQLRKEVLSKFIGMGEKELIEYQRSLRNLFELSKVDSSWSVF